MKVRRASSILLSMIVVCAGVFISHIPAVASGTVYEETIDIYQYAVGTTITWTHSYDGSAFPEESAELTIVADDVDGPGDNKDGEQDAVYFNGHFLGYLNDMGSYSNWNYKPGQGGVSPDNITTTTFSIDVAWLADSMIASVVIEPAWGVEIETAKLSVVQGTSVSVSIDIKPWSYPNSINSEVKENAKNGVVPVAILGSSDLDVESVNWADAELYFGPEPGVGSASPAHVIGDLDVFTAHIVYPWVQSDLDGIPDSGDEIIVTANNDLIPDLVVHFPVKDTGFSKGCEYGYLWGEIGGLSVCGVDTVHIVK